MPATIEQAIYLFLSGFIAILMVILAFLVRTGFSRLFAKFEDLDDSITELSAELRQEREDRIEHYGKLRADLEAHRATCNERHRIAA
jgi:hypothetical protein